MSLSGKNITGMTAFFQGLSKTDETYIILFACGLDITGLPESTKVLMRLNVSDQNGNQISRENTYYWSTYHPLWIILLSVFIWHLGSVKRQKQREGDYDYIRLMIGCVLGCLTFSVIFNALYWFELKTLGQGTLILNKLGHQLFKFLANLLWIASRLGTMIIFAFASVCWGIYHYDVPFLECFALSTVMMFFFTILSCFGQLVPRSGNDSFQPFGVVIALQSFEYVVSGFIILGSIAVHMYIAKYRQERFYIILGIISSIYQFGSLILLIMSRFCQAWEERQWYVFYQTYLHAVTLVCLTYICKWRGQPYQRLDAAEGMEIEKED